MKRICFGGPKDGQATEIPGRTVLFQARAAAGKFVHIAYRAETIQIMGCMHQVLVNGDLPPIELVVSRLFDHGLL